MNSSFWLSAFSARKLYDFLEPPLTIYGELHPWSHYCNSSHKFQYFRYNVIKFHSLVTKRENISFWNYKLWVQSRTAELPNYVSCHYSKSWPIARILKLLVRTRMFLNQVLLSRSRSIPSYDVVWKNVLNS